MKRIVFFALLLFSFAACQDDAANGTGTEETNEPETVATLSGDPVVGDVVSPQTQQVLDILTNNYWLMEVYVKIKDKEASLANRGRWWSFNPDGTFTSGRWMNETSSGTWTFDPQALALHLDNKKDDEDSEFTLKISHDGSVMIWIGTERYNQSMVQAKMGNYMELPANLPGPGEAN